MFPNLLCGVYMYFDRSKELRTYCAQFWRSPSQLQMEVFKAMVIAGYSCLRKEPGTGVGVIDIFFSSRNWDTWREHLFSWHVEGICFVWGQCCALTSNMFVLLSLCSSGIWQIACNKCTKSDYLVWKSESRLRGIRILDGGLGVVCSIALDLWVQSGNLMMS